MLKTVKTRKYKNDQYKVQYFTRMAALISGHPVQKSVLMNCNLLPSLKSCTSSSKYLFYLFRGISFLINLLMYMVEFWQYNVEIKK